MTVLKPESIKTTPQRSFSLRQTLSSVVLHTGMTLLALLFLAPLYLMLVYATHPDNGIYSGALWFGSEAVNNFNNL